MFLHILMNKMHILQFWIAYKSAGTPLQGVLVHFLRLTNVAQWYLLQSSYTDARMSVSDGFIIIFFFKFIINLKTKLEFRVVRVNIRVERNSFALFKQEILGAGEKVRVFNRVRLYTRRDLLSPRFFFNRTLFRNQ